MRGGHLLQAEGMALESDSVFREFAMSSALRPLFAACVLTVLSMPVEAKTKHKTAAKVPTAPTACSDFYSYVNTDWLRNHPLPAGIGSFSRWDELNALAERQTHDLATGTQAMRPGIATGLLADLVASGGNEAAIESAGLSALQPLLAQIDGIRKPADIARVVASLHAQGVPVLFDFDIVRDTDNGQPRAYFKPAGLGLVDPAYYTSTDPGLQHVVMLYRTYIAGLLAASGVTDDAQADAVLSTEIGLAKVRTQQSGTKTVSLKEIQEDKGLAIGDFLRAQGVTTNDVVLQDPEFFEALNQQLGKKAVVAPWRSYLRFQVVNAFAPYLNETIRNSHSQLFDIMLAGRLTSPTRAERVAELITGEGAELLSNAYAEGIPGANQQQAAEAVANSIRDALSRAIDRAAWLRPEAKTAAHAQLSAMRLAIGRSITPVSFTGLQFQRDQLVGNVLALHRWQHANSMARMASPIWPWPVSQTRPLIGFEAPQNRLIVTAAALQAPVFDGQSDAAAYGAFAALLAQQMTQDVRRLKGEDAEAWATRTAPLIAQFDGYTVFGGQVSGARTVAQNAADLTGLEIAWDALNAKGPIDDNGKKAFFGAWAGVWARQDSTAEVSDLLANSEFAPSKWRVNGALGNLPAFAQTYACKAGQPMFKPETEQTALWR
jgi:putative endopeptidase